ncbi:hypothetical protein [Pseudomonas arsenicoxydans]|nr:hypothetical protein [Pseudomonas arsenicoxydans]
MPNLSQQAQGTQAEQDWTEPTNAVASHQAIAKPYQFFDTQYL